MHYSFTFVLTSQSYGERPCPKKVWSLDVKSMYLLLWQVLGYIVFFGIGVLGLGKT